MKNQKIIIAVTLIIIAIFIFAYFIYNNIGNNKENMKKRILLETSQGEIEIELYETTPITSSNFENLTRDGLYDNTIFHRVIDGFMIQGGDPTGTGIGDPNIPEIKDEFPAGNTNVRGTIAMANRGPNTGSSQFFINLADNTFLDGKHPIFGKVVKGMDVVDKIAKVNTDGNDKPIQEIRIIRARVLN